MGVKRVCIPNRSTKSAERRREQKKRWFRNGQKWRTGCEGRISVVKRRQGQAGWVPIYSTGAGRSSFEDIHVSYALQLRIAAAVLWENLQNFFTESLALWLPGPMETSSASSAIPNGSFGPPGTPGAFAVSERSATGH